MRAGATVARRQRPPSPARENFRCSLGLQQLVEDPLEILHGLQAAHDRLRATAVRVEPADEKRGRALHLEAGKFLEILGDLLPDLTVLQAEGEIARVDGGILPDHLLHEARRTTGNAHQELELIPQLALALHAPADREDPTA